MDYRPDFRATGRWLRTSGDLRGACRAAAQDVADAARGIAPVDEGHYRASIDVVELSDLYRVGAGVEASDDAAAPIEFGNRRTRGRGQHVLTRAAEIVGLDVR
ncbi:MAG TPA: HK97 gp10 family phage protein [Egibacteraceae bacterium]|nr:HK97 gp10 family phage protein [Egibacteraceae bacterium]